MAENRTVWTVLDLLRWTADHFTSRGIETARLDAECLLAHALGSERLHLYLEFDKPVQQAERAAFRELVRRRADERVPVALLTGRREFWSLDLRVTPDVLVPRPETETLVEAALALLPEVEAECSVLDLGTGSGAIGLALAKERPKARITAVDVSEVALQVAAENAEALGLADRVRFLAGDLYAPTAGGRFDLVVSNPPYLAFSERESAPPELAHEPSGALYAGEDGAEVLREVVFGAPSALEKGGALLVELAPDQVPRVSTWMAEIGLRHVTTHRDLAGRSRVVCGRREPEGASNGEPSE